MESLARTTEYYRRIDAGDIDWVVNFFAIDATYDRAGNVYRGRAAVDDFYRSARTVSLTHHDLEFWCLQNHVFVEGTYRGHGADGSPRCGKFADHWCYGDDGLVLSRRTSLFVGAASISK